MRILNRSAGILACGSRASLPAFRTIVFLLLTAFVVNLFANQQRREVKLSGEAAELDKKIRRFAPTVMTANTARLSPNDRKALQKIIAAAKLYDPLYLRQIWSGNE